MSEIRLVSIAFCSKENKQHFHKPVFISVTFADSHGCLKNFVKLVFQQLIGSFHQVLQALGFWVILLKFNFNDEI